MYSESVIKAVWDKGIVVEGYDKNLYRKDAAGAWIAFASYGNRDSVLGWEVDHGWPQAKGGGDEMENLRPLHWQNNDSKGVDYPVYNTAILAEEDKNVPKVEKRTINANLQSQLEKLYGKCSRTCSN